MAGRAFGTPTDALFPEEVQSFPGQFFRPLGHGSVDNAPSRTKCSPDGRLHWIILPGGPTGVFVIGKQADREPNRASTNRNVTIDQYSGQILHLQDRKNFTAGETFLEWQYPLHCGEAFGNIGRAFIMFMGFVPLILFVTGFMRWRQKRRVQR